MSHAIRPFTLAIAQHQIDDLHQRLDAARWPERETVDDWSQGTPLAELRKLVDYWRHSYDWRRFEARLNGLGQFVTELDGLDIHFLHIRSPEPNALPLLLTHGWPGSLVEFLGVIEPLSNPAAHGAVGAQAFDLVIPSLPGYGFSQKPSATGWDTARIAKAWGTLMRRLGYDRWVAQGGDWGAAVTTCIGEQAPEGCLGIHLNMPVAAPTPQALANPDDDDKRTLAKLAWYRDTGSGYAAIQRTRPQTIGYGLVDSPVSLAGWILDVLQPWSDNDGSVFDLLGKDAILDNIMLYWLPATGASASRLYWQSVARMADARVSLPFGASIFPGEILDAPRSWMEQVMSNIVYWNRLDRGGHFAAWEQPAQFAEEMRACFALMV